MGAQRLIRAYYIANAHDGAYFVLTTDIQEYIARMSAYIKNLVESGKTNHYSFGSVEMYESEYEKDRAGAGELEKANVVQRQENVVSFPKRK